MPSRIRVVSDDASQDAVAFLRHSVAFWRACFGIAHALTAALCREWLPVKVYQLAARSWPLEGIVVRTRRNHEQRRHTQSPVLLAVVRHAPPTLFSEWVIRLPSQLALTIRMLFSASINECAVRHRTVGVNRVVICALHAALRHADCIRFRAGGAVEGAGVRWYLRLVASAFFRLSICEGACIFPSHARAEQVRVAAVAQLSLAGLGGEGVL